MCVEMKTISIPVLIVIIVASAVLCPVLADSQDAGADAKNSPLLKSNGNDEVNATVQMIKRVEDNGKAISGSAKELELKGRENEVKKPKKGAKNEQKGSKGLHSDSKKESNEERLHSVGEKCDSLSNSCADDDKTLVACLRVPGNESPELSLLIQNKGKGPLTIAISAPELVQIEKKQIELQEKEDTEVKVSVRGVESGHLIVLSAGHGNCSLDFRDQFEARTKVDHTDSTYSSSFSQTSSALFLFLALLVIAVALAVMGIWRRYFARKGPKYQKLDADLPISHSAKPEQNLSDGWDDGWGESWDDEEAPSMPSMPLTPSLSSRVVSSRKFGNKEGWKD